MVGARAPTSTLSSGDAFRHVIMMIGPEDSVRSECSSTHSDFVRVAIWKAALLASCSSKSASERMAAG